MKKKSLLPQQQAQLDSAATAEAGRRLAALADQIAYAASHKSGAQALRDYAELIRSIHSPGTERTATTETARPPGARVH